MRLRKPVRDTAQIQAAINYAIVAFNRRMANPAVNAKAIQVVIDETVPTNSTLPSDTSAAIPMAVES
jgi:hypothetical protein